jgi:prepilin peptidase CpaA
MPPLPIVLLLVTTAIAAVTDIRSHKIYNWTTYPGILLAFAVAFAQQGWNDDYPGLEGSLKGFALCGGMMLVCFLFFGIGGGDVKLLAMMGAFLGMERGVEALLWTFVLGSAAGLATLIWRVGFWRLLTGSLRHLGWSLRLGNWLPLTAEERLQLAPPLFLAPSAFLASVIVGLRLSHFFE